MPSLGIKFPSCADGQLMIKWKRSSLQTRFTEVSRPLLFLFFFAYSRQLLNSIPVNRQFSSTRSAYTNQQQYFCLHRESICVKHLSTILHTSLESKNQSLHPTAGQWVRLGERCFCTPFTTDVLLCCSNKNKIFLHSQVFDCLLTYYIDQNTM